MTGEKNRGVSLEKLWNLDDKQLTSPKHDDLVLSANKKYMLSTFPDIFNFSDPNLWYWNLDKVVVSEANAKRRALSKLLELNSRFNIYGIYDDGTLLFRCNSKEERDKARNELEEETKKQIEISKKSVDYYIEFCELVKTVDSKKLLRVSHEVPIVQKYNKFIIGYWDIVVTIDNTTLIEFVFKTGAKIKTRLDINRPTIIYIEAKPYIDSYGAVLRQIKTYCQYIETEESLVCLLTPDNTFTEAFEDQGIKVICP